MPDLLGDFIEPNTLFSILCPPKFLVHPGVHGIDARCSRFAAHRSVERFIAAPSFCSVDRNFNEIYLDHQNLKLTPRNMAG
ncbi:hypothetical protein FAZ69_00995 [Trinickia terrae]|uniref:Uncharacterized protein n=1 Tax=Trinickia terrae TaxID=2571161 RepID=A0A4U1IF10_9BURK|nr:hypothetical protein FAZ69_00995 [Trinickia terrae]